MVDAGGSLRGVARELAPAGELLAHDAAPAGHVADAAARSTPAWHQVGATYQVHLASFMDSNGDGIGDFAGLTSRLDHIKSLCTDTIWLTPFNTSPMRDGGYDVADFLGINPKFGTMDDFRTFMREAKARQLHVIMDLPLNHTSVEHPWFQRARLAPPGSPERDFYVWSDTADRFAGTPVNFADLGETSNWQWDAKAGGYYWHRWYSHQPDLNYDNLAVVAEMKKTIDFWMDEGVDGLRLDAAPFLVEREGTIGQGLPETHRILADLRAHVDTYHPGRVLLAEANEDPEILRTYFDGPYGPEMNMAFNFPLMPRMWQAAADRNAQPVLDALRATEGLPEGASWATFLRNHDEMTLSPLSSDAERDAMRAYYAPNPSARVLGGIRRRVMPLVGGDQRQAEMMHGMMFSLPGKPIVYYGDEIGMGDNIFLNDRDSVRTPMQWVAEPGGGFSLADPATFHLPMNSDARYGAHVVNVASQEGDPTSLLSHMRDMVRVHAEHPVLATGSVEALETQSKDTMALLRGDARDSEQVLATVNLSPERRTIHLTPDAVRGMQALHGGGGGGAVLDAATGTVTLEPYSYQWFTRPTG